MVNCETVRYGLGRVNWDFPDSRASSSTIHALHWFPGNFIPQIPSFLIQILSEPGGVVLDPFCGSGTTGVEALLLGRIPFQSDVCSASVQVARGKMASFHPNARAAIANALRSLLLEIALPRSVSSKMPDVDARLRDWFHPSTLDQLLLIWGSFVETAADCIRPVFEMLFSDTLFACASSKGALTRTGGARRHHWGWVADNVRLSDPVPHDALFYFRERLLRMHATLPQPQPASIELLTARKADARNLQMPGGSVDLIVTSPPYLGMIDYTTASRLMYYWMGWRLEEEKRQEIGARWARNRLSAVGEYTSDFASVAAQFAHVLKPAGYCAVVVGTSRKHPLGIQVVAESLERHFKPVIPPIARSQSRRRVADRTGSAGSEYIYVFQKPAD
jgi:hypothetical protein